MVLFAPAVEEGWVLKSLPPSLSLLHPRRYPVGEEQAPVMGKSMESRLSWRVCVLGVQAFTVNGLTVYMYATNY